MDEQTRSIGPDDPVPQAGAPETWGPFRLLEPVGHGGFGQVYRAFDTVLEREVALKLLFEGVVTRDEEAMALREARAMAKIRHPNVVSVYGVAQHDGRPGFWSDFVRGKTLSELLESQGPFGPKEAAMIGIDVARAAGAVHAAGLLHRDIKASNVMREEGGRILLMDFGLSHHHKDAVEMAGTVKYMAPELLAGKQATVASDIYAIGVLLYHLLTGKYPPRRLLDERPDLPERLAHAIETAIHIDPAKRYSSTGELIAVLSESAGVGVSSVAASQANKSRWIVALLAAMLAIGVAAFLIFGRHHEPPVQTARADYMQALDLLDHYYQPHNIQTALELFRKTTVEDPTFAAGHAGLGRAYWWQYRDTHDPKWIEPAKAATTHALELDRDLTTAHVTLGMIYTDAGRSDVAAEEIKQAIALNAHNAEAYSALAELYQKEGRTADVEPTIQKAVDLAPTAWRYLNQLGLYYMSTGKYDKAAEQYQQAVKLNPDNARAYNNLGLIYSRENRLPEARTAYERAIQIAPTFNTVLGLGAILEYEGNNQEAVKVFAKAVDMNPSSYVSWSNLASAYNRIPGNEAKARENYLKAIALAEDSRSKAPNEAKILADLGSFYAAVGMSDKSVPMLRQAGALAPEDPQVLYRVAEGYELLHRREDALRWIGKAIRSGFSRQTIERNPELSALRKDPKFGTLR